MIILEKILLIILIILIISVVVYFIYTLINKPNNPDPNSPEPNNPVPNNSIISWAAEFGGCKNVGPGDPSAISHTKIDCERTQNIINRNGYAGPEKDYKYRLPIKWVDSKHGWFECVDSNNIIAYDDIDGKGIHFKPACKDPFPKRK